MTNYNACQSHCCKLHGCKYGHTECPVVRGFLTQQFPCEYCPPSVSAAYNAVKKAHEELALYLTVTKDWRAPKTAEEVSEILKYS